MVQSARRHGPFDDRQRVRPKLTAPSRDRQPNGDGGERLEWSAFLGRFFPNRRRHDFAAVAAYEAYRNTFDQRTSQQEPTHDALAHLRNGGSRSRPAAAVAGTPVPVTASSAAVLSWESEGGASGERPTG
jgi:hypothetical protein